MGPSLISVIKNTDFDNQSTLNETISLVLTIIENGEEKFISLIESLGYLLTSQKDDERKQGTRLLVDILNGLKKDFLLEKEVEHLVTFFTERLKDFSHIVPFVIQGLLCLTTYKNLPEGSASVIILCLYHNLHIPSQLQNERYACYSIVGNLIGRPKQLQELQSLPLSQQSEVVLGFLQACDGERDPRCLLLAFRVGKMIGTNFPLGAMTEDFFESFNCYFPVDFKPPDDNQRAITREELAVALRDCLACSPAFAEFLFPFWLDKIDSTLDLCKLDCLDLLKEVCNIYISVNVEPFLSQIWSKLRREVLTNDTKIVEEAALESLACLVRIIDGNTLIQFISKVWRECEALLDSSSDGLKIIIEIAKASEPAGYAIMNLGLPSLLEKISPTSNATEARKVGALSAICSFLNLDKNEKFSQTWQTYGSEIQDSLFSLWHVSGETKLLAMRGLSLLLSQCPNVWTDKETDLLVQHLIFWTKELESDNQTTLSGCWNDLASSLSKYDHNIVLTKLLPMWLENIKSSFNVSKSVSLLSAVASTPNVKENIVSHILKEFDSNSLNINHLKCLLEIAKSGVILNHNMEELFNRTITLLIGNRLTSLLNSDYAINEVFHLEMKEICSLLEYVTPSLNKKNGSILAENMINLITTDLNFNELSAERQLLLCELQLSIISQLPKESLNSISNNQISIFTEYFCQLILNPNNDNLALALAQILSCILNKRNDIDDILRIVEVKLPTSNISSNLVITWIWICKALVLRGHNYNATDKLLEFLGDEISGKIAAEGFSIILEKENVLSGSSSSNIKLFYQQRFFMTTHKKLLENYQNSNNDYLKNNYLRALTHQLKYLPAPVLKKELPPLLPMLISSLAKSNNDLLLSVLGSLKELLSTDITLAVDYLNTLINRMTMLSTQHPNMMGRILALECLYFMALLPEVHTIKYAKELVLNLKPCLGDRKRLVRKQATLTISKWYLHINCKE